jgi:hypothetical protein
MRFDMDADRKLDIEEDVLVHKYVPKRLQKMDPELFSTKWFDYRRMTPFQATLCYIDEYRAAYRRTYRKEFDAARAEHVQPINGSKLTADLIRGHSPSKRKFSAFWRGRQVADALTIPYNLYLDWAFYYRMRHWSQGFMPQPQHLYHEFDVERIQETWEEQQASIFFRPKDPAFLVHNYRGISYQNDFHEWLFKQAWLRNHPYEILAMFIEENFLPVEKVEQRLGDEFHKVEAHL